MFNRIKEKKGGFTLVELIIVLVILAILAAFLVPTLTGYVDRANEKSLVSEARLAVMAAQTITDEAYATGVKPEFGTNVKADDIKKLAEIDGTITAVSFDSTSTSKITSLTYKAKDGKKQCVYTATPAAGEEKYKVSKVE